MKTGYLEFYFLLVFFCISCMEQFTWARHARPLGECQRCPVGYGVLRPCTARRDTECGACGPDHYSGRPSARRPCLPCSRCGPGLYEAHVCTPASDTVCDSCHTVRGPRNRDFYDRCVAPLLVRRSTTDVPTTTEQHDLVSAVELKQTSSGLTMLVSAAVVGAVVVTLLVACFLVVRRRRCKRANSTYFYEAVATKEAIVML